MKFDAFDHQNWCGPNNPLAQWVGSVLDSPADRDLSEGDSLTMAGMTSPGFEAAIANQADRSSDPALKDRWQGLKSLALFVLTGDEAHIDTAVSSFDLALGQPTTTYDRPRGTSSALNRFGPHRRAAPLSALEKSVWTPGTFIVYDFLAERCLPPAKAAVETTPILAAGEMAGLNDFGAVLSLEVEALPGPGGLITPDFWTMGLGTFGKTLSSSDKRNFLSVMHDAFRMTLNRTRDVRLRWRLRPRKGIFPRVMMGRSAEAAAACCVWALMHRGPDGTEPLLDPGVAITATLERPHGDDLIDLPLGLVRESTLDAKFRVAANAGLTEVLVCEGQVAPEVRVFRLTSIPGQEERIVLIQSVPTLNDAYDQLLVTSAAVANYKVATDEEWKEKWTEQPTPQVYIDASQKTE